MSPLWKNIFNKSREEESLSHFLGTIPIFSELTERDCAYLATLAHVRNYADKEIVFAEGDPGSGLYIVRSGRVKIFFFDGHHRERELAVLGPADFFGETTLAAPAMRTAAARTIEKAQLVGFFRSDLLEVIQKSPQIANRLLLGLTRTMSERLHAADQELQRLQQALTIAERGQA